ncbi:glycosyltransferase family 2 protein [Kaistia dalseonensis]|uniref:Glycosyltransferase n=1 Tax=Kaistia dalseonensis TaxID=410840 RepID=A0ABU0H7J4_9HYPH|nr:glycosyltransferase family 2 protein [Kaistia dalseonensis]MCX5495677.1 glycosyltransferase family 2 protein [Kaistia dalseonensis]MDQ0438272.1 putative glycosyltransferase [Kaistia dalseonensis]
MSRPKISVVATAYNSERYIEAFAKEMRETLDLISDRSEIIIVDDGSTDDTIVACKRAISRDADMRLVELSRNFGQEPAILAGLRYAQGEFIFLIDSDLEEPPSALIDMIEVMRREVPAVDVVYGVQLQRNGTLQHTFFGGLFYKVYNALSDVNIPDNILTIRLMTRRYVDSILMYEERTIALAGIFSLTGFRQVPIVIHKKYKGYSGYSAIQRAKIFIRYLIIFGSKPALLITLTGLATAGLALIYSIYVIIGYIVVDTETPGWTSLALLTTFFNGLLLISIGVCAAYLAFIFEEVKKRPVSIVRTVVDSNGSDIATPELPVTRHADMQIPVEVEADTPQ